MGETYHQPFDIVRQEAAGMNCRLQDLRNKEVINVKDGARLGCVCDVEIDTCTARLCAIVIFGRLKCFGLMGREEDIVIHWCDIEVIGEDTILVCCQTPPPCKKRTNFSLSSLWG